MEHHGSSGQPPEQTVTYAQRTLCGPLESTGLLQWLVFATVPKDSPSFLLPSLTSYIEEFLLTEVCWFRFSSVSSVYKTAGC